MTDFNEPRVSFNDTNLGRAVTVHFNQHIGFPTASVAFIDNAQPEETNAHERARVLAIAKSLFQKAANAI